MRAPSPTPRNEIGGHTPVLSTGQKDKWEVGEVAWFEYQCNRSHKSSDAPIWYRSHQQVTIFSNRAELYDPAPDLDTLSKRREAGQPRCYEVKFADGLVWAATECELYVDKSHFDPRLGPPAVHEVVAHFRNSHDELVAALKDARQEIISLAETGTARIVELGGACDPAERTYAPSVGLIDAALKAAEAA